MHVRRAIWLSVLSLLCMPALAAQDAPDLLRAALQANGLQGISTIHYHGTATSYNAGLSRIAGEQGRRGEAREYAASMNFGTDAMAVTGNTFEQWGEAEPRRLGGMQAFPGALWSPDVAAWTTPWGFLKGAEKHGATVEQRRRRGRIVHVVSWRLPFNPAPGTSFRVTGYLNEELLVESVEGWTFEPVFGDMATSATFSDYRADRGVRYPARIVQTRGDRPYQELRLQGASVDPADSRRVLATIPLIATPPRPIPALEGIEKLSDGVYLIRGFPNSLAVEFADHVLLFEPGAGNEARTLSGITEARRLFPGKAVRYGVVSSHHAVGGIRTVAEEGITLVTTKGNEGYLRSILAAPRTFVPDALARSGRKPRIEAFRGSKRVFKDDTRSVEIHVLQDMPHIEGMVVAWLPQERILAYSEGFYTLPRMVPIHDHSPNRRRAFVQNLERLGLAPQMMVTSSGKAYRMTLAEMHEELVRDSTEATR